LKLKDWIDPRIEKIAEDLYKDTINFSLGKKENLPWTTLDPKEKESYRLQAKELSKKSQ